MSCEENTAQSKSTLVRQFSEDYKQQLFYLEKMPAAVAIIRIDLDNNGEPCDFVFVYVNDALAKLEGVSKEKLLGSSFYDVFENGDKKWLMRYWKTAYLGIEQEIEDYSPEIDKQLIISCYQPMYGYCGCVLRDITERIALESELQRSRSRLNLVLQNSVDVVFNIDLEKRILDTDRNVLYLNNTVPHIENIPYGIYEEGLILESGISIMNDMLNEVKEKETTCSNEIQARLNVKENFEWHALTIASFIDSDTGELFVVGFMKNIHEKVLYRQELKRKAERDGLTGIYNVATGKKLINKAILNRAAGEVWAMLFFDVDNFKKINDSYGHAAGDLALRVFSNTLLRFFSRTDIVYRLGGDEFVVFLPITDEQEFEANICVPFFAKPQQNSEIDFELLVSCGIAVCSRQNTNYEDYYKAADEALYEVKKQGGGNYRITHF